MPLLTPVYIVIFIYIWRLTRNIKWQYWGYIAKAWVIFNTLLILPTIIAFISNGYATSWLIGEPSRAKTLGPEHLGVAQQRPYLRETLLVKHIKAGREAYKKGHYGKSEQHFLVTVKKSKRFGDEHPRLLEAVDGLATSYDKQGKYAEAEPVYRRALTIRKELLGPNHRDVATSLNNLATVFREQGKFSEAEPLSRRALVIREKVLGPNHPDLATNLNDLALLYQYQGKHSEAEPLYNRAWAILGDHPHVVLILNNLTTLHSNLGNHIKALSFAQLAIDIYRDHLASIPEGFSMGYVLGVSYLQPIEGRFQEQVSKRLPVLNYISAATSVIKEHPNRGEALIPETFEVAQLAQVSNTAEAVTQMAVRSAIGDVELSRLERTHQDVRSQWRALDATRVKLYTTGQDVTALTSQIRALEDQLKTQTLDLRQRFPDYSNLNDPQPVTLAETQQLLAPDEALLVYLVSQEESYLWVVRKDHIELQSLDIGQQALDAAVASLRKGLDPSEMNLQGDHSGNLKLGSITPFDVTGSHALYTKLIAPALSSLEGVRHLMVVPDVGLQSLPFGVLVTTAAKKPIGRYSFSQYRKIAWLADQYALTTLPAVGSLRALRRFASREPGHLPFIGFGDLVLQGPP